MVSDFSNLLPYGIKDSRSIATTTWFSEGWYRLENAQYINCDSSETAEI